MSRESIEHMESMDKSIDRCQTDIQNVWQCVDHNAVDQRRLIDAMSSRVDLIKFNQDQLREEVAKALEETNKAISLLHQADKMQHEIIMNRTMELDDLKEKFKFNTARDIELLKKKLKES